MTETQEATNNVNGAEQTKEIPNGTTQESTTTGETEYSTEVVKEERDVKELLTEAQQAKTEGNKLFADGQYEEALQLYTKSIDLMQGKHKEYAMECSIFFSNRAACHANLKAEEEVVKDCTSALELNPDYTKALVRRAAAHEALKSLQKALDDYEAVLKLDPMVQAAKDAVKRLPNEIRIQQEREKEEMIGKLKELGNSILGKFGLSTDNFQFDKDPSTGNYSMNFKK